ncbi:NAD(P)/FAD-dependent oxidoreductase [Psychrobacter sp. SZ93C1]|uniref:NAD(P)/FAD-dependent oxidoreductase n=1 Tax=Psychrobacter sp. SZ93C1 TaxID=2792058 RepID=UPI0018CD4910|nr:FAD-dependent oxidoreductase [Psychrobacter sp. SZ93C1]MBH0065021.1 FAD-dependent oxidoreductase [Psychrobacter sp. SZ93C1]
MSFIRRKRKNTEIVSNEASNVLKNASSVQAKKRIAIIGSGVSGLTCAHYLVAQHDVTVFEANDYIGGHVNTIDVALQDGKKAKTGNVETSAIDTGFIVFNERTYPNFFRLLYDLKVPFQSTDMSFSVKNTARHFEYNGHTLNTLLSQRKNVLNPKFWRFIKDILQFNKHIKQLRQDYEVARAQGQDVSAFTEQTLGNYLTQKNYGNLFTDNYLLPMVSAIWSTSLDEVQDFPLVFFAQFFDNHGLLDVVNRPQWFTIKGGSKQYVNKLVPRFIKGGGEVRVNSPVQSVVRDGEQVLLTVQDKGNTDNTIENLVFDEVIFACHADTALKILKDASTEESEVLGHFRFTKNTAVLHTDISVLPKKPLAWASWNYLIDETASGNTTETGQAVESTPTPAKPVLTYHMNILQRLTKQHNYLVTLNPETVDRNIDDKQVIKSIDYSHPVFDLAMIDAQTKWSSISGNGLHTHFCGAYWFNGFHEDGVRSGLRVCQALGHNIEIKDDVDLTHLPDADSAHTPFRYKDMPIKADTKLRKINKREVIRATTNQELVEYAERLQSTVIDGGQKKKRGLFGYRNSK